MLVAVVFLAQVIAGVLEREVKGFADLFHRHSEFGAIAVWVWSVLCQALPAPGKGASWVQTTFYNLAHLAAGNLRLIGKRAGGEGLIDRRLGTGSFTKEDLARMTKDGAPKE